MPEGYKLTKVVVRNVVYANNSHKVDTFNNVPGSYIQPYLWGSKWEIRNFRKDSYQITYPNSPIRVSTYEGPANANMTISETASSSFTASTGVDLKLVEAKLGHTISQSVTVSDSFSVPVARGKILKVQAFVLYDQWRMDAYKDNKFVGTEFYHYPVGVSFKQYTFDKK